MQCEIPNAEAMEEFGRKLGRHCASPLCIYLQGDLGAGKTTLTRGILRSLGYQGKVKSPTYTLVEPYALEDMDIYHFDLYRLADAEELGSIGVRDYFAEDALILLEWPEKAEAQLPVADLQLVIHILENGRRLELRAQSPAGEKLVQQLQ